MWSGFGWRLMKLDKIAPLPSLWSYVIPSNGYERERDGGDDDGEEEQKPKWASFSKLMTIAMHTQLHDENGQIEDLTTLTTPSSLHSLSFHI